MFCQSQYLFIFFQRPFFCNFIEDTKCMLSPFWSSLWPQLSLSWWGDSGWELVTRRTKHWIIDGNFQPHADLQPLTSGGKGARDWALQRILNKGIQSACRLVLCGSGVPFTLSHAQVTLSSSEKDELSALPVQVWPSTWVRAGRARAGKDPWDRIPTMSVIQGFWFQSQKCCLLSGVLR